MKRAGRKPSSDREFGDLLAAVGVAHGCDQLSHLDFAPAFADCLNAGFQSFLDSFDGFVQGESLLQVLFRRPPDFAVHHAVVRQVLDEFLGHPEEAFVRLHHGHGVVEGFQVADQGPGVR